MNIPREYQNIYINYITNLTTLNDTFNPKIKG